MNKLKCKFTAPDMIRIKEILEDQIQVIQAKKPHELSEVIVYRLFIIESLLRRFRNKCFLLPPTETVRMSLDLKDVLTLKYCLMGKLQTPGTSDIFMKLDKYIHPAMQLEMV